MRASTWWNVDPCPTSGTNCLGTLSRETGHSRVPAPPHMITGMIKAAALIATLEEMHILSALLHNSVDVS